MTLQSETQQQLAANEQAEAEIALISQMILQQKRKGARIRVGDMVQTLSKSVEKADRKLCDLHRALDGNETKEKELRSKIDGNRKEINKYHAITDQM